MFNIILFFVCIPLSSMEVAVPIKKSSTDKKPLCSLNHLNNHLQRQVSTKNSKFQDKEDDDEVSIEIGELSGKERQPKIYNKQSNKSVDGVMQILNPVLYQFGKDYDISTEELMEYAQFLQKCDFQPAALVEFINNHNRRDKIEPRSWQIKKYEDLQKNNSDAYQMLVLNAIKKMRNQLEGKEKVSVMNTTHVNMLHDHIEGQEDVLYKGKIAFVIQTLITLGTFAWGIYGQITQATPICFNNTQI